MILLQEGRNPTYIPVPLKSVDVSARLVNYVAEVTITQTYLNVEEGPIECKYMFPIEEAAAVIHFKAELEGKTLVSQVLKGQRNRIRAEITACIRPMETPIDLFICPNFFGGTLHANLNFVADLWGIYIHYTGRDKLQP